jgi:membrane protein
MSESSGGLFRTLKRSAVDFLEDECPTRAAALAYYTAFSLPPLLVLIVTVAGWIWDPQAVSGQVEKQVTDVVGQGGWIQIQNMMSATREQTSGGLAAIVGIAALLFGATGVMVQLQSSLNRAWEVQPDPEQGGVRNFLLKRVLSLAMILAVAFLLLVSLVLTSVLNAMAGMVTGWLPEGMSSWVPMAIHLVVSFVVFSLLFAAMMKWLPDANVLWRDTWVGAGVTALLFLVGKFALGLYFGMSDTGQYGAAASFALILLWVYYSGMIFLFGAEFTQAWSRSHGRKILPEEGAVRIVEETRHVRTHDPHELLQDGDPAKHTGAGKKDPAASRNPV